MQSWATQRVSSPFDPNATRREETVREPLVRASTEREPAGPTRVMARKSLSHPHLRPVGDDEGATRVFHRPGSPASDDADERAKTVARIPASCADRTIPRATRPRRPERAASPSSADLPANMLVLRKPRLLQLRARVTEISRSAAFVSCTYQPTPGQQVVIRVSCKDGAGVAVGAVQTNLKGVGFSLRVQASTGEYRDYADKVRRFLQGKLSSPPALTEPLFVQIL